MHYDILLTKQPANGYLARPILMPEIVVYGADEAEVLARVQEAIAQVAAQSRIVRIAIPSSDDSTAPLPMTESVDVSNNTPAATTSSQTTSPFTPVKLGGLWQDTTIEDEDIAAVRHAMWAGFGDVTHN